MVNKPNIFYNKFLNVMFLVEPSPVKQLVATESTCSSCYLSWDPPKENGGSKVIGYVVEQKEIGRKAWCKVIVIV